MNDLGDRTAKPMDELEFARMRAKSLECILRQYGRHHSDCKSLEPCAANECKLCDCGWSDVETALEQSRSVLPADIPNGMALDVSLEKARALHRVWRALNDGDCPKCHRMHAASEVIRDTRDFVASVIAKKHQPLGIACPTCGFKIAYREIERIEELFAPAMDAAVSIFEDWRFHQ